MALSLIFPEYYPYVMIVAALICAECWVAGFIIGGGARAKAFNKELMEGFRTEHEENFPGNKVPIGGSPDMGNGYFAKALSYEAWSSYNNSLRAHYNFLEHLGLVVTLILLSGYYLDLGTLIIGCVFFIGRLMYTIGYVKGGPTGRFIGGIFATLSTLALFGTTIYGIYKSFDAAASLDQMMN